MKYKLLSDLSKPPKKRHEDSGYDLFALLKGGLTQCILMPHCTMKIPTGIALEIPQGVGGFLHTRSSYASRGLIVTGGVIDSGYRGEVIVNMLNTNECTCIIGDGDKICQIIFLPLYEGRLIEADVLSGSVRGESGFGSTGN